MLGFSPPTHQGTVRQLVDQAVTMDDLVLLKLILTRAPGSRMLIESQDLSGTTAVHKCCFWGHHRIVSAMIDNGIDINVKDNKNRSPLHVAAMEGHREVVRLLLDSGADPYVVDMAGMKAFELCGDEKTRRLFPRKVSVRKCKSEHYETLEEVGLSFTDKKLCRSDSGIVADQAVYARDGDLGQSITYESFTKSRESVV